MGTEIRKFHGFYWTEFKEEEQWLEELAGEGLLLKKRGPLFSAFEKSLPAERRYRIFDKMKTEEKDLIELSGWTCTECGGTQAVFFTDDPETVEIITDRQGFKAHFGKLILSAALHLIGMGLRIWLNYRQLQRITDIGRGTMHGYDMDLSLAVSDVLFWLLVILCCGWAIGKDIRYILRYGRGEPDKVRSHRKCLLLNKVRWGACLGVLALLAVMLGSSYGNGSGRTYYGQEALDRGPEEMVPFPDADVLMSVEVKKPGLLFKEEFCQSIERASDPYDPESPMEDTVRYYSQRFYNARSEKIACDYLNEEILIRPVVEHGIVRYVQKDISFQDAISIPLDGVDYAGYETEDTDPGSAISLPEQTLYLRKGTKLMIVSYIGTEDLKSKAVIFAEKMDP